MIGSALATGALPYLIKDVFDDVFKSSDPFVIATFCVVLLGAFIVKGLGAFGESVTLTFIGQRVVSDIQNRLFNHLLTLDLAFYHSIQSGELISRFMNDVQVLRTCMSSTLIGMGKDTATLIVLVIVMFLNDPFLASFAFLVFPIALYPILKIGKKMRRITYNSSEQTATLAGHINQIFGSIRVVKAYQTEEKEAQTLKNHVEGLFVLTLKTIKLKARMHPIVESLGGLAIVCVIAYCAWQISHGTRTTGNFISFILAFILAYEPLKRLSNLNAHLQEGVSAAKRLYELLDVEPTIKDLPSATDRVPPTFSLKFDHVYFYYEKNKPVLQDISLTIEQGKTVALVGPSGGGKTTLLNLIPRFYDVSKGTIFLSDDPLQAYTLKTLRRQMALVSQEIALFDRTVYENIAYGMTDTVSSNDVIRAAQQANAHDFIISLPQGYDTVIGENGVKLSGGQRQRIAVARAFLKNAPIILLDEATSALDNESERIVHDALSSLMKGRTTVMIAHRLTTVMNADCIYVIDQGRITEQGTHDALLARKGTYAHLWEQQLKDGSDDTSR